MDVPGTSSQTLAGEIGLSEFENVFAEVSICPETMKLLQKSLRETHFEATVTRFEFSWEISRKSKVKRSGPGASPIRQLGEAASCADGIFGLAGRSGGGGQPVPMEHLCWPCVWQFTEIRRQNCSPKGGGRRTKGRGPVGIRQLEGGQKKKKGKWPSWHPPAGVRQRQAEKWTFLAPLRRR